MSHVLISILNVLLLYDWNKVTYLQVNSSPMIKAFLFRRLQWIFAARFAERMHIYIYIYTHIYHIYIRIYDIYIYIHIYHIYTYI